ncbi:MAG: lytic murein transglycosylase [Candidatus Vogelbacteria bacterium]|nr:lytic murein transglycosylase [Candidatus Vogelbacteria bacterium]
MGKNHWLLVLIFSLAIWPTLVVVAQTNEQKVAQQAKLEAELRKVEAEIAAQTKLLQAKQKETASITRDVSILTFQINTAKLNIQAKQLEIKRLGTDIGKKTQVIGTLISKIDQGEESLSELLRNYRQLDDISLVEVALADNSVSNLFGDFNTFDSIQASLHQSFSYIRDTKSETEKQKSTLESRQAAEINARQIIENEKVKIERAEKEKKALLAISKGQESQYRDILAYKQKQKEDIRNALFRLRGVSTSISFGQALDYATAASQKTGVRPALILAILTQETNLGQNIGTCNRPGDPPEKHYTQIMKPTRDLAPYLEITKSLGLNPEIQPLSCPYGNGYGGAMGPSQFIPSTWVLYRDRVAAITGNRPANPWVPRDAFTATSLLMSDLGAASGDYASERRAALKYYAGGNWQNPANAFYGNSVMSFATTYQSQIDILQAK